MTSKLVSCGLPKQTIVKLQRVQNASVRTFTHTKRKYHITPIFKDLHWLSISKRILYKLLLITNKTYNNLIPEYLRNHIESFKSLASLCSAPDGYLLKVRDCKFEPCGKRAYQCVATPRLDTETV